MLVGFAPLKAVAQTPQTQTVSFDSPLIPDVDGNGPDLIGGQEFRLLFLTNTGINGESNAFGSYNTHVQTAAAGAAAGDPAGIRIFSSQFRALVSVGNDMNNNARNNTATTGAGVPIYWLLGAKVADNYGNFYDGGWDSRVATNENGTVINNPFLVWTGSKFDGTRAVDGSDLRTMGTSDPRVGLLNIEATEPVGPIDGGPGAVRRRALELPLYAMSPVIIVRPDTSLSALALSGNPPSFPAFSPATTDYRVSVPNDVTSITLMPTPNNTNATVTIEAPTLPNVTNASGASINILLNEGLTVISIVVIATADNDASYSTTYTVRVTRLAPPPLPPPVLHLFAGSPLAPPRLTIGEQFRLLFVGGISRFTNDNLSHYNDRVTGAAADGHADIRTFADEFRALVSNATVDARDNTATRSGDVPIYWLGGDKVADDYDDFYDGSWDSRNARNPLGDSVDVAGLTILTGSLEAGVGQPNTRIGDRSNGVRIGRLDQGIGAEINSGGASDNSVRSLYGLSPVLMLLAPGPQLPVVQHPIPDPDQNAIARAEFSYTFPANSFYDINMDELTYSVAAPAWLTINPVSSRTVRGTPPSAAVAQSPISVTVVASDGNPTTADVSDTFLLTVNPSDPAPPANVRAVAGDRSITVSWDPLVEDGGIPVTLFQVQVIRRFGPVQSCFIEDDPGATSCTITTGLFNGIEYSNILVRAFTNPGTSLSRHSFTLRDDIVVTPLAPATPVPPPDAFVTTWGFNYNIEEPRRITIPTHSGSTYAYTVDWGDGSNDDTIYHGPATHTYPDDSRLANYVITISDHFPHIYFNNGGDKDKIRTIRQWGSTVWSSMEDSFSGCTNLTIETGAGQPELSAVTDMSQMFDGATSFNQQIGDWEVGSVTNMTAMFQGATSFNQPISNWDVSLVTNMRFMFREANAFNQPLGDWKVSSVINMNGMFRDATEFDQDLGAWDVGKVENMADMFNGVTLSTTNYDSLLTGWSMVEDGETELRDSVPFHAGDSQYCAGIAKERLVGPNNWLITDGESAANCPLEASAFVTTWVVQADQAITIPTNSDVFTYNYAVDWGDGAINIGQTRDVSHSYTAAGTYTVSIIGTFPQIFFNNGGDRLAIRTVEQWGDIAWGSMQSSFEGAANLTIATNAGRPDLSAVTSMRSMFQGALNLNSPIGDWDVSNVTDMANMFQNANAFDQPLGGWDVSSVTNTSRMFNGADRFNQDLGAWDVGSVTDMTAMFYNVIDFDQDLGAWDVGSVTNMAEMFNGVTAFDQDLGAWNVGSVKNMTGMFRNVTLSRENYDSLLAGWSMVTSQRDVNFHAGNNSQYCNQEAKDILLALDWMITDGMADTAGNCALRFAVGTSIANQVYPVDTVITLVLPSAVGGAAPLTYNLVPLPPGLTFFAPTADIAALLIGTPSAIMSASPVIYTATADNGETATLTFMITVVRALPPATLTLGTVPDIDLNLKFPVITADGKIYYYLDADNSGEGDSPDLLNHAVLDILLNNGDDTENTQEGMHNGSDDARSVRVGAVGAYTLILPTLAELKTLRTDQGNTRPFNWGNGSYRSATRPSEGILTNRHHIYDLGNASEQVVSDNSTEAYVAFQVLSSVPISFKRSEYVISEGTTRTITLVAEQPPVVETRIRLFLLSGTMMLDEKYRLSTIFITFNPDQSEASFEVSIVDDNVFQETREFSLSIVPVNNSAQLGDFHVAAFRVENDDVKIGLTTTISGGGNSLTGTEGSHPTATLRLNIDPPVNRELSVNLLYTDDVGALTGALSLVDTPDISTVITVPANKAVHPFDVIVKDDQIAAEPIRTATILLEEGPGYLVSDTDNMVKLVVIDNDVATVSFSQSTGTVTEGESIELIITQDLITDIATSVNITFTPMGNFFKTTPITTQVDFPAGGVVMSTSKIVIPTVNDADVEAGGSLRAQIMIIDESPLQLGTRYERTVTILNDDVPAISFQQEAYTIFEGTTGTIRLLADQPPVVEARISLTTDLITILNDEYRLSTTTIVFEPSQSTASFEVSTSAREGFQTTRKLRLSFVPLDGTAKRGAVFETIISVKDNAAPIASLEIVGSDPRLEEGDSATLRVTLDRSFKQATTIQIVTIGTATLGQSSGGDGDYTIKINQLMLSEGSTYAETTLEVNDDVQVEPDETIILTLEADTEQIIDDEPNARLALTIKDNDVPAISFKQAGYVIFEGTTGTVTLVADQLPVVEAQIRLTTLSGTADGKYRLSPTIVVFKPGQRTASFEVEIFNDNILQATRELSLSFDPLTNSTRGEVFVTVISIEDNAAPIASLEIVGGIRLKEGGDKTTLRITLDRAFNQDTTIRIVTTGTATTEDYTININRLKLSAGSTYAETTLVVIDDMQVEANETIILTLEADTDLIIDDESSATLTIEDNDVPAISFERDVYNIAEGTTGTVTLVAKPPPEVEARISLTALSGTVSDNEYQLSTTIITFEPGQSTASFEVSIFDDDVVRSTRELSLSFDPLNKSATRGTVSMTVISVGNNDVPAISFDRVGYDISEGTTGTVTLVADQRPVVAARIRLTTLSGTISDHEYRLSTTIITFEPDQSTASFEVSIIDDNDVQATRKLRLSFVPRDKNSKPGTVSETVITVGDDELEVSLRAPGQAGCRSPSPPESTPNCQIVVTESDGFGTLQLEASRLTAMPLTVNLSYTADVGALTGELSSVDTQEMSTMITVATNTTTRHIFKVPVIDDEIAAEFTRVARVVLRPGGGYTVSDTDNTVEIAVVDNDVATVSISSVRDRVIEGDTIVFTVTRDLAMNQASSISLTLTHNGDFFSPAMDPLNLDNGDGINLELTNRNQRNGKVYYYLVGDKTHNFLDRLLNGGVNTDDTQLNGHIGSDDERSVIIDDYALVLPTFDEIRDFLATGIPDGWDDRGPYWAAGLRDNPTQHFIATIGMSNKINSAGAVDTVPFPVFFQVLTAQRTISVDLPAEAMGTVTVEVATIDTADSITDGSLIAELIAVTSPIELGSTVSEVAILHNNLIVTVTGLNGEPPASVDENSSVTLVINVGPSVPNHRSLDVNLSYIDAISSTTKMRTIEVPAGRMSQDFQIPVGDDDIAAQSTRFFSVTVEPGVGYRVGTPSSVAVSVLDDDVATVSISPVSDTITEGEDAVFKVMLDIQTAVPAAVRVKFTGNEESVDAMYLRPVVVTFAEGETSIRVTVATNNNNDLVMDSSLSATLTNVTGSPLLISSTQRSAMIMILDDTPIVGVTTFDGDDPIQVLENADSVTLQLNINPTFNRALEVNVLYSGDPGALTGDFSSVTPVNTSKVVTVRANAATQTFDVEVIDDQIAAEFIRRVTVSVIAGLNYKVAASSSVEIAVVDDDIAAVSISALKDRVIEGDTIVFTVTQDLATDQATSISLTLTYNGDFFSTARKTLNLDNGDGIHLNLTGRHKRNGKVYYYLDHNDNSNPDSLDQITHILLDNLLNDGANTINTQPDGHDGSNDERSVIIDGYALVLPTAAEIKAFLTAGNNEIPDGWANDKFYWAAGPRNAAYTFEFHESVEVPGGNVSDAVDSVARYVFFQVLTAQRTTIVNLPAEQMNTVVVEVATIDTDDSTTDGSLIAELKLIEQDDSPIELGSPDTSKVAILHNNFVVTVTGPNGESSVSVDEDSSVDLVLNVGPSVPDRRSLGVGLSYIDIISGTTNMITIEVPEGSTSRDFSIPIGGDSIAAQSTRFFNVLIEPDIGYVVGASSSVAVSVLNDDPAVVSILPVRDPITEGDFAVFEVQVSNEIAVSLTVTINFTTVGNFGISPGSTKLVITADNTTALLTVGKTINDKIGEAYGSLTAAIVSPLTLPESIFGVKPTISATHSSATITILDDDLDLSVRITTLDKKASTTISESDEVISLRLMLSVAINRPLRVNLSRDTEISGIDLPSFVEVPAEMTTHNFSVFVIDDTIVAQPERNIAISVDTGVGYTASTVPVTVKVIDNDTATVTISPVNSTIVQSEPAVFKVMLGLETAVDVEIGIDVEFGEGFITNQGRSRTTVTVLAGQMSTLLTVPTVDNTEVEETSSLVATLVAIPHLALTIGDPSSATVVINALGPLRIEVDAD